jgi:hypothetical protein
MYKADSNFALTVEEVGGQRESQGAKAIIKINAFALTGRHNQLPCT